MKLAFHDTIINQRNVFAVIRTKIKVHFISQMPFTLPDPFTTFISIRALLIIHQIISGQTPLMLAESSEMEQFIKNHLHDVQNTGPHKQPWKFPGPWYIYGK